MRRIVGKLGGYDPRRQVGPRKRESLRAHIEDAGSVGKRAGRELAHHERCPA